MQEIQVRIQKTKIFDRNREAKTRFIFNPGGTRSSKTHSLLQLIYAKAVQDTEYNIYSIVSETMPHLRKGAMRDFYMMLNEYGVYDESDHNKSDNIYKAGKSIIEFFSVDQASRVHGPERDYLYCNEVNNISYDTFFHLAQRTRKQIYADWNPVSEFWIYPEFINNQQYKSDITVIHSTIFDNPFVSEAIKTDVLRRAARDENYRRIYLLGEIGIAEGCVITNWRYENEGEIDEAFRSLSNGYGLDYGFNPDPDAMIKVAVDERQKKIYAREMLYKQNNKTSDLIASIRNFYYKNELIIAESANPRTNADLAIYFNIRKVSKTETVAEWLRKLQEYEIIIDKESVNLARELRNYIWNDKKAGIPIDAFNHLMDAFRYYYMATITTRHGNQTWHR